MNHEVTINGITIIPYDWKSRFLIIKYDFVKDKEKRKFYKKALSFSKITKTPVVVADNLIKDNPIYVLQRLKKLELLIPLTGGLYNFIIQYIMKLKPEEQERLRKRSTNKTIRHYLNQLSSHNKTTKERIM